MIEAAVRAMKRLSRRRGLSPAALCVIVVVAAGSLTSVGVAKTSAKDLTIYFVDVEGGQATLVVTPDRHSLLIDTGFAADGKGFRPGDPRQARDANRILAAARDAGVAHIDYLLITHFHPDHDGGVTELSQLMPIGAFIDHGVPNADAENASAETKEAFKAYSTVRGTGLHLQPSPGDDLPLKGLEVVVGSVPRARRSPSHWRMRVRPMPPARPMRRRRGIHMKTLARRESS